MKLSMRNIKDKYIIIGSDEDSSFYLKFNVIAETEDGYFIAANYIKHNDVFHKNMGWYVIGEDDKVHYLITESIKPYTDYDWICLNRKYGATIGWLYTDTKTREHTAIEIPFNLELTIEKYKEILKLNRKEN